MSEASTVMNKRILTAVMTTGLTVLCAQSQAASFDCAKAGTKVEHLICDVPELSRLDDELAVAYKNALADPTRAGIAPQAQKQWLKDRNTCRDVTCIRREYQQRLLVLSPNEVFHSPNEVRYTYTVESGTEPVCGHMKKVYSEKFRTPWDGGHSPSDASRTLYGVPYDQLFERLPGVPFDLQSTFWMRLSRFPTSPEFEALRWQEIRQRYSKPESTHAALVTRWVSPDGSEEPLWIVKATFMHKMTTHGGWGQGAGGGEVLHFSSAPAFMPSAQIDVDIFYHDGKRDSSWRSLGDPAVGQQLRPFAYAGHLYIAAYIQEWKRDADGHTDERQLYPDKEYMDILKLAPGITPEKYQNLANTEVVCRIRMKQIPHR